MGINEELPLDNDIEPHSKKYWLTIKIIAFILLGCMVASIELSTIDLNFASFVYGSDQVWIGHRASFRIGAIDAQTKRPIKGIVVKAVLKSSGQELQSVEVNGPDWAEFAVKIPKEIAPNSPLTLEIAVETEQGTDNFALPLTPLDKPGPILSEFQPLSRLYQDDNAQAPREVEGYQLKLYPLSGHLVSGLSNTIASQLLYRGSPSAGVVQSTQLKIHQTLSDQGIAHWEWTPMVTPRPLVFMVGSTANHKQTVRIKPRPSQLLLKRASHWRKKPGTSVSAQVESLPFRGRFHLDVWAGSCLLLTTSETPNSRGIDFSLKLPPDFEGMLRVDAYKNFMAPSGTVTSFHTWISSDNDQLAMEALVDELTQISSFDEWKEALNISPSAREELMPLILSRLFPITEGAPLLRATLETRKSSLTAQREELRRHVHQLFFWTIVVGVILLAASIISHKRKVRKDVTQIMHEGVLAGEDWDSDAIRKITHPGNFMEMLVTFGTIALILYSIYILLTQLLKWGW